MSPKRTENMIMLCVLLFEWQGTVFRHLYLILLASISDVRDAEERFAHAGRNQTTLDASDLEESKDNNVSQLIWSF